MDRLDYLNRDSFYTGVLEGKIGAQRIIKMLDVLDDHLVIEEKGVYSVEKFIIARRLMYWQVYLHKTVLASEQLLVKILLRAKELSSKGASLFASPALQQFLLTDFKQADFDSDPSLLEKYAQLDDYDIYSAIKVWVSHQDVILSRLCDGLVNRRLYKIRLQKEAFTQSELDPYITKVLSKFSIKKEETHYFAFTGSISNNAYDPLEEQIHISYRNGDLIELTAASDQLDVVLLSSPVKKHFLCLLPELLD